MATKKGKEIAPRKPAAKRAPQRPNSKVHSSLRAKPLSKKGKTPAPIDENDKGKPAKDSSRFLMRYFRRETNFSKTPKSNRQVHRVASSNKTHGSEVDPTGIDGSSNFSE